MLARMSYLVVFIAAPSAILVFDLGEMTTAGKGLGDESMINVFLLFQIDTCSVAKMAREAMMAAMAAGHLK